MVSNSFWKNDVWISDSFTVFQLPYFHGGYFPPVPSGLDQTRYKLPVAKERSKYYAREECSLVSQNGTVTRSARVFVVGLGARRNLQTYKSTRHHWTFGDSICLKNAREIKKTICKTNQGTKKNTPTPGGVHRNHPPHRYLHQLHTLPHLLVCVAVHQLGEKRGVKPDVLHDLRSNRRVRVPKIFTTFCWVAKNKGTHPYRKMAKC